MSTWILVSQWIKSPYGRLFQKIRMHRFHDDLVVWIQEWPTHRGQKVGVEVSYSERRFVMNKTPQRSVLGPLLFTIHINDLDTTISGLVNKPAGNTNKVCSSG